MLSIKSLVVSGALAAATLTALPAHAASTGPCANLPNPVYINGSTAIGPFILAMGPPLAAQNPATTLIYQKSGGCSGPALIISDTTPQGACATGTCLTGTAPYYDAAGVLQTCDLDPAGTHVDIAVADTFPQSCVLVPSVPASVGVFAGPVQAFLFVTSKSNPTPQQAITAEEAYFVFGFGGAAGMASPWTKLELQLIRNSGSGTQTLFARALGIPPDKLKGTDAGSSGGVISQVGAQPDPATIGILSADNYDIHRDTLAALAYKNFRQWFGYYADSTPTSFDKANVRDGHYWLWAYSQFLTHVDGTGKPLSAGAQKFLDLIAGKPVTPAAPFNILDVEVLAHTIPLCAMKVKRTVEAGPLSAYADPAQCGCYFEQKATGATSCTACLGADGDACTGGGVCRHKFCEAN